jgi:DNA repair protein RecN (Recombination protein N)
MLVELMVENFAVAERLRLRFRKGLTLLTGETGSGKSILVDALGLLLGGRSSIEMIRSGAERARISGIFDIPRYPGLVAVLEEAGIPWEDEDLLLEREIAASGKSRAFVANKPVTVSLLRSIAPYLGDIHGQNDQQQLFDPAAQLNMLDTYAGHSDLISAVDGHWQRMRRIQHDLDELDRNEREKLRLSDLWQMQLKEIESVGPREGEDEELEQESRRLKNVTKLAEIGTQAYAELYDSPESATVQLQHALRRIEDLARIDGSLQQTVETLRPALIAVEEVSLTLRDYVADLEANPSRLDEVESRLLSFDKLKRKYGETIPEILAFLRETRDRLAALEDAAGHRARLQAELAEATASYRQAAANLSDSRRAAASRLSKEVEEQLASLAMGRAVFVVQVAPGVDSALGQDEVHFLVSANLGEEPKPLEKVASGGEVSRIALALKTSLASLEEARTLGDAAGKSLRTLVFDEVDTGISGRAAESVGRKLKLLAQSSQVLCVTHLPQIASFADNHYAVEKVEEQGRTISKITELGDNDRITEVARMLSGEQLTEEALRNAQQLIRMNSGNHN